MAKNKTTVRSNDHLPPGYRELQNFTHKDLKKACILKGMSFEEATGGLSHPDMVNWYLQNYDRGDNPNLLTEYDAWREAILVAKGHKPGDPLLHPDFKFGHIGEIEKLDKPTEPRISKVPSTTKPKAEMDEKLGVRKGTKKAMTYELTNAKVELGEIIKQVQAAFPGAEEKSIKIWQKRCLKDMKEIK